MSPLVGTKHHTFVEKRKMSDIVLKFHCPSGKEEHWKGLWISFYSLLSDVFLRKSKMSVISFFDRERLSRDERKLLIFGFQNFIKQLEYQSIKESLQESSSEVDVIPEQFVKLFSFFSQTRFSNPTTDSHQAP